ncbi:hypothetical protein ACVBEJ_14125 [Porticoccus sp. GXU_MW_L64]
MQKIENIFNTVGFISIIAIVLSMILVRDPLMHGLIIIAAGAIGLSSIFKSYYISKKPHNSWLNLGFFLISVLMASCVYFVAWLIGY